MRGSNYKLPNEWYQSGDEEITAARILLQANGPRRTVCFHCHQVAEKYLKGFLLSRTGKYPKSHDLLEMITICQEIDPEFTAIKEAGAILNPYYIESRYLAATSSAYSQEDCRMAVELADSVIQFVRDRTGDVTD